MNALTKSPIAIDRPADKDCADECPKCVGPLASRRVAVSESEQSTKCTRDYQYCLILVLPFKRIEHRLPLGIVTWPRQERLTGDKNNSATHPGGILLDIDKTMPRGLFTHPGARQSSFLLLTATVTMSRPPLAAS